MPTIFTIFCAGLPHPVLIPIVGLSMTLVVMIVSVVFYGWFVDFLEIRMDTQLNNEYLLLPKTTWGDLCHKCWSQE